MLKQRCKKALLPLLLALSLAVSATSAYGGQANAESFSAGGPGVSGFPWIDSCIKENVSENWNPSVKDDFHLAVNYEWILNTEIPEGRSSMGALVEPSLGIADRSQALFEDESLTSHDARLIKNLYHEFLNWEKRDAIGMEPVMPAVRDIQSISSLDELSAFICDPNGRALYTSPFFTNANVPKYDDSSRYIYNLYDGTFLLGDPAEYTVRTELGERYYRAKKELTTALLAKTGYSSEDAAAVFDSAISFDGKLAEAAYTSEEQMDPNMIQKINNVMSLSEAAALAPNFPLKTYTEACGYGSPEEVIVDNPAYFRRLNELYTEEHLEEMKSRILVSLLLNSADLLDREAYDLYLDCSNAIAGKTGRLKESEDAYHFVSYLLSIPLDKVYLEKYDASKTKKEITDLCEKIAAGYRSMLQDADWLSEETRAQAINKLDHLKIRAVYPDKWRDYSGLSLDGLSLYDCAKRIYLFDQEYDCSHTNQKVDHDLWDMSTLLTNAYYDPAGNSITILLGILDGEFYREDMSTEELYAGIGNVIGHEISHAFDTTGAQYDAEGNLFNWWTEEDLAAFQARADKLIAYYNSIIPFDGQHVIGSNVQGEAIADMTGMANVLALARSEANFDYDLFFRQYAKIWKEITSREAERSNLTQDPHPLSYLRTNVTVQQFQEFYDTYGVEPGDGMYLAPEDRINVW